MGEGIGDWGLEEGWLLQRGGRLACGLWAVKDRCRAAGDALLVVMFPDVSTAVHAHWTSWGRARLETGGSGPVEWYGLYLKSEHMFLSNYTTDLGEMCTFMVNFKEINEILMLNRGYNAHMVPIK